MSDLENPPAFAAYAENCGQVGMTLRDWFAGQALPALLTTDPMKGYGPEVAYYAENLGPHDGPATLAYKIADAMLAERKSA